jgi:2-polyprenyl-3-methyl-5-hydroxy-6-metoxy-1,4-benzoquinol methylase
MRSAQLERNLKIYQDEAHIAAEEDFFRWQADKFALLVEEIGRLPEKRLIADIGSYTGLGCARFLELDGVEQVHAFDASQEALKLAASRGLHTHPWVIGEDPCPLQDRSFDLVVASDLIEHLVDTDQFLKDLRDMITPTGHVIITTPNLGWWFNRLRLLTGKIPWGHPGVSSTVRRDLVVDLNHIRLNLTNEWSHLFEHHGFRVEKVLGYRLNSYLSGWKLLVDKWIADPHLTYSNLFLLSLRG